MGLAGGESASRALAWCRSPSAPIAAIRYEVEPLDGPARISVQSELLANEQLPSLGGDPRLGAVLEHPLTEEFQRAHGSAVVLVHRTEKSGLRVGTAMDHLVEGPKVHVESQAFEDGGVVTATAVVRPWAAAAADQIRRVRLVRRPVAARGPGSGVGRADHGPADGLGRPARRAARVPR